MSEQQPTEAAVTKPEHPTPAFQNLAPVILAQNAGLPGDEMVLANVPKAFEITLSDGSRKRVRFEPGTYPIPKRLSGHYYLKANGVVLGGTLEGPAKPQLEGGADPKKASEADEAAARAAEEASRLDEESKAKEWPADADLDKMAFSQLASVLLAHGVSEDDVNALGSKALRAAKIRELVQAEADAKK